MIDLDRIGNTPLLHVEGIYVKLECSNPGGSVKDRIARFMLQEAIKRGELKPGDTIVEATSGNTGIAMAMVGRALGHPVVIYMPEHMSVERRRYIETLLANLSTAVISMDPSGTVTTANPAVSEILGVELTVGDLVRFVPAASAKPAPPETSASIPAPW